MLFQLCTIVRECSNGRQIEVFSIRDFGGKFLSTLSAAAEVIAYAGMTFIPFRFNPYPSVDLYTHTTTFYNPYDNQ